MSPAEALDAREREGEDKDDSERDKQRDTETTKYSSPDVSLIHISEPTRQS